MSEPPPGTLGALLEEARRRLGEAGVEDAGLEARLIVEHFTATTRAEAIAAPERTVENTAATAVLAAVAQRLAGLPVHRILGYREFYGLRLRLSPATLEPRPDTETLVDLALPEARRIARERGHCRILDLGTGTGAIALAILNEVPEAQATGSDISEEALATARANADIIGCGPRFATLRSDGWAAVSGKYDLIVSNPPYIRSGDIETLPREVREHDPLTALDGGADGLRFYRLIAADARRYLEEDGAVAVEIGYDQKSVVEAAFAMHGYRLERSACDLGGRDRAMLFKADALNEEVQKRLGKVLECR